MFKKILSVLLVVLVMNLANFAFAGTKTEKEVKFAEKVRSEITRLGTGTDAKIEIKLKDGTKLKGYVAEANNDQFIVTDSKSGQSTLVSYPQVQKAKGNNFSKRVIFGVAIVGAIIIVAILAAKAK